MRRTITADTYENQRRALLWSLLGDTPARLAPPEASARTVEEHPDFVLERLVLDLNGTQEVPALLLLPRSGARPFPCVVFNHSHGGYYDLGKNELTDGVSYRFPVPMATSLARAGLAAIAVDHWGFGERRTDTEVHIACNMLWRGQVMWGMMVYDSLRAVDYLMTRTEIDPTRIGTTGMSMGSTMAWWLAALDSRIACCVDVCCLTEFSSFLEDGGFHAPFYYVPSLLKHFTTAGINELIAPRPHLALEGDKDPLTPSRGLDVVDAALKTAYRARGAADAWCMKRYPIGHVETEQMRAETIDFLSVRLGAKR